jgi:hypothetical protein
MLCVTVQAAELKIARKTPEASLEYPALHYVQPQNEPLIPYLVEK